MTPRGLERAQRVYRVLLRAYPRAFRRAYGDQLAQVFRDWYRDAAGSGRLGPLTRFWWHTLRDLVGSALAERWAVVREEGTMRGFGRSVEALTVLGASAFGWLCLHTDETGVLACSVLLLGGAFGLARPRQAWRAALLLGLAAPAAQALAHLCAWPMPFPHGPLPDPHDWTDVVAACLALVFSSVGAAIGAALGWGFRRARDQGPPLAG